MSSFPSHFRRKKKPDLFEVSYGCLLTYARKLTKNRSEAEDLVQEAWCLTEGVSPEHVISPFSYLRTVIHNLFVSNLRRQKRERRDRLSPVESLQTLPSDQPSPEDAVIGRLEMERLEALINKMPPRQSTAIRMYHFENRKLKEIAENLDISISFTQSLIVRGLESCAEELDRTKMR